MGNGFRSCIHSAFDGLMCVLHVCLCLTCVMNCIWNIRVEKHNLRGLENKMNMKIQLK